MSCRATCIPPSPTNAHCGACHHTFSGVSAFDRHRRAGECLSPLTIGLRADQKGVWRYPAPDPTVRDAWPQRDAAHLTPQPTCLGRDMDCGRALPCPDHPSPPTAVVTAKRAAHQARHAPGETL